MSTTIDQKVVEMRFDNQQFETNVKSSLSTLDKLKQSLQFDKVSDGFDRITAGASKVDMNGIADGVETVGKRFSAMEVIGITALANITNSAVNAGKRIAEALTISSLKDGFSEYELKMNSVQTIMAGTGESIETVGKYLNELNEYADKTIYSFSDMTSNIGKFTNAGVKLKDAVAAIQGVSNVAAVSGANTQEASRAMYNFAQALSAGYTKLIDWKSIENANMATVEFKNELLKTALAIGTVSDAGNGYYKVLTKNGSGNNMKGVINATKNFNDSLAYQWMTTDVLIQTLNRYSDTTTEIGKKAAKAATEVKTFSQLIDTIKEALGTGWADTWEIIIGNFEEAKAMFTDWQNVFSGIIDASTKSRNAVLSEWKNLGGRDDLLATFRNLFNAIASIVKPIKEAFETAFKPLTGQRLKQITENIKNFTKGMQLNKKASENLKNAFTGLFSALKVGVDLFTTVVKIAGNLAKALSPILGLILNVAGGVGNALTELSRIASVFGNEVTNYFLAFIDALSKSNLAKYAVIALRIAFYALYVAGQLLGKMFEEIGKAIDSLNIPSAAEAFNMLAYAIYAVIGACAIGIKSLANFIANLGPVQKTINAIGKAFEFVRRTFMNIELPTISGLQKFLKEGNYLESGAKTIVGAFIYLKNTFSNIAETLKVNAIEAAIDLFGAAIENFKMVCDVAKKIPGKLMQFAVALGAGIGKLVKSFDAEALLKFAEALVKMYLMFSVAKMFSGIGKASHELGELIENINRRIKVTSFTSFAKAIAVLAASIAVLSFVDTKKAMAATGMVFALITYLGVVYTAMQVVGKKMKLAALAFNAGNGLGIAATILGISASILIIVNALKKLDSISWEESVDKLKVMGAIFGALTLAAVALNATSGKFSMAGSATILIMVKSMNKLYDVLKQYENLKFEEIRNGAKVVAGVAAAMTIFLGVVGLATKNSNLMGAAATIGALVLSLKLFAGILQEYSNIDWSKMWVGAASLSGTVIALGMAVGLMTQFLGTVGLKSAIVGVALLATLILSLQKVTEMIGVVKSGGWDAVGEIVVIIAAIAGSLAGLVITLSKFKANTTSIIAIFAVLISIAASLKVLSTMDLTGGLIAIGALFGTLLGLYRITELVNGIKSDNKNLLMLAAFTAGLAAVVLAMKWLLTEPIEEVEIAMAALMMLIGTIGAVVYAAAKVPANINSVYLVGAVSVALLAAAASLRMLAGYAFSDMIGPLVALGVVMGLLTGIMFAITKLQVGTEGVVAIIALSASLVIMAGALMMLASIDTASVGGVIALLWNMVAVIGVLGAVAIGFGALSEAIGVFFIIGLVALNAIIGTIMNFSIAATVFGVAVNLIGQGIASLGTGIATFVASIANVSGYVDTFIEVISQVAPAITEALLTMSVGVGVFGLTLMPLASGLLIISVAVGALVLSAFAFVGVLTLGATAVNMLGNGLAICAESCVALGNGLSTMITTLAGVSDNLSGFVTTMGIVMAVLVAFGSAVIATGLLIAGGIAVVAASLILLGTAIGGVGAVAVPALASIGTLALEMAVIAASATVSAIALGIMALEFLGLSLAAIAVSESFIVLTGAAAALSISMVAAGLSITTTMWMLSATVGALAILLPVLSLEFTAMSASCVMLNNSIGDLGLKLTQVGLGIQSIGLGIQGFATSLVNSISSVVSLVTSSMSKIILNMESLGVNMVKTLSDGITNSVDSVVKSCEVITATIYTELSKSSMGADKIGAYIVDGLCVGMKSKTFAAESAARDVANAVLSSFQTTLDINSPSRKTAWFADMSLDGFIHEVYRRIKEMIKVGVDMATTFLSSFQNEMGIHSDSDAMEDNARFTIGGFIHTIAKNLGFVSDSGKATSNSFLGGFSDILSGSSLMGENAAENFMNSFMNRLSGFDLGGGSMNFYSLMGGSSGHKEITELSKLQDQEAKIRQRWAQSRAWYNNQGAKYKDQQIEQEKKFIKELNDNRIAQNKIIAEQNKEGLDEQKAYIDEDIAQEKAHGAGKSAAQKEQLTDYGEYWSAYLKQLQEGVDGVKYKNKDLQDYMKEVFDNVKSTVDDFMSSYKSTVDSLRTNSIFDAVKNNDAKTFEEIRKNTKANTNQMNKYVQTLYELHRKIDDPDLWHYVDDFSQGDLKTIENINKASKEELGAWLNDLKKYEADTHRAALVMQEKGLRDAEETLNKQLGIANADLKQFVKIWDGTWESINRYVSIAASTGGSIVTGFTKEALFKLDNETQPELIRKNAKILQTTANQAYLDAKPIGSNIVEGLIKGIEAKESKYWDKLASMQSAGIKTSKKEIRSNSPSKVYMKIGKYIVDGLIIGLDSMKSKLMDTYTDVVGSYESPVSEALDAVQDMFANGINTDPVIKPVLDLTDIQNGTNTLNSIMNGYDKLALNGSMSIAASTANSMYSGSERVDLTADALNKLTSSLGNMSEGTNINNTFNITGNNPNEIADAVSRRIQQQVERRSAAWA